MTPRFMTASTGVLLLFAVLFAQSPPGAADQAPPDRFSVSVDCQTFPERGAYSCDAVVSDLASGKELLAAHLNGRLADTVKASRSLDLEGTPYRFEIDVSAGESAVEFEFRALAPSGRGARIGAHEDSLS